MIVKPTVNELLEHAENRFALVIAVSRRARQISKESKEFEDSGENSPVTVAAKEVVANKVKIYSQDKEYGIEEDDQEQENAIINDEKLGE